MITDVHVDEVKDVVLTTLPLIWNPVALFILLMERFVLSFPHNVSPSEYDYLLKSNETVQIRCLLFIAEWLSS